MSTMGLLVQRLRKEVRWLVIRSDMMDTYLFSLDVIPEMMKLDVEVFRSRSILVDLVEVRRLQNNVLVVEIRVRFRMR